MPVRQVLVDSGPLIALFNRNERRHAYFDSRVQSLARQGAQFLTTWPCVTEATHMLKVLDNRIDMLHWIAAGGVRAREFPSSELLAMAEWMRRYSQRREMDFADASLMWLAISLGTTEILTVDRADFERYRLPSGKAFSIL
jgi:uncharacterized protein